MKLTRKERYKKRQEAGVCRNCNNAVCPSSKNFCEYHLKKHHENTAKTKAKYPAVVLRNRAARRNITFEFTNKAYQEWYDSQPKVCHYCGVPEQLLSFNKDKKKRKLTIDRMDNDKGYSTENCCLACYRCNHFKSDFFSSVEWMEIAERYIRPRLAEWHRQSDFCS